MHLIYFTEQPMSAYSEQAGRDHLPRATHEPMTTEVKSDRADFVRRLTGAHHSFAIGDR